MKMEKVTIEVPEDLTLSLNKKTDEIPQEIKLMAAIKLYELGRLSLGKASELAGIDKMDFMFLLAQYKVPLINYSDETFQYEKGTLQRLMNEK